MTSQNQTQKSWYKGVSKLVHSIKTSINCAFVARVVKYDKKKHIADIQPLANEADGTTSAQLLDVPVDKNVYVPDELIAKLKPEFAKVDSHVGSSIVSQFPKKPYLRKGVCVICVVLDKDSDSWAGDATSYTPGSSRQHDINNCVIVGIV